MDSAHQISEIPISARQGRRRYRRLVEAIRLIGGSLALMTAATACVATVEPEYAVATDVPPDITIYPHTVYEGRVVYLVNDHWYYRGPDRHWVYYRQVPPPLYERRTTLVRERPYVQAAPPARHVVAPPARQVVAPPARHNDHYDHRDHHDRRRIAPEVRSPVPATQVR